MMDESLLRQAGMGVSAVNSLWTGRLKRVAAGLSAVTVAALVLAVVLSFAGDVAGGQAVGGFATITGLAFVAALITLVFQPATTPLKFRSRPNGKRPR